MRAWFITTLKGSAAITAHVPADAIVSPGALGLPQALTENPTPPFIIVRWSDVETRRIAGSKSVWAQVWVHDFLGSYVRIDEVLGHVKDAVDAASPVQTSTLRITEVSWEGESGDLLDDMFGTATRYAEFKITGRALG